MEKPAEVVGTSGPVGLREGKGLIGLITTVIAVLFALFHVYTGGVRPLVAYEQRGIHLTFALILTFLLTPYRKGKRITWIEVALALISLGAGGYLFLEAEAIVDRMGIPTKLDLVAGGIVVLLVLEATRRLIGLTITVVAIFFLVYAYFGYLAPIAVAHEGYSIERIVSQMSLATEGIFGVPLGASATFVILFVIFAAFLSESGAGQFFLDISMALFGRFRGGPAKVSVMSSSLFGTISGSAVANVMVDGWLTIPLMKKTGFRPHVAGAIEAVTSTGGQIMPPVMGAAAFVMAEILGVPYIKICVAAAIPAVLYYVALYFMIDFEALKSGIRGLPPEELPNARQVFSKGFIYLIPIVVLIYFMSVQMYTPLRSAVYAMVATVVVSFFRKSTRMGPTRILKTLERGAKSSLDVALACACAGIIVGVFNLTGLGMRLSSMLIELSQGNLLVLLLLTMVSSLILGMGMPTTACYIILAVLVAPAMIQMGVKPLAAHLFVLYFGCISAVTPPVALAAYAGAGLAQAPPTKTGYTAFRFALAGFILPFMFVFGPELLIMGHWSTIVVAGLTSIVGVFLLAASVQGYLLTRTNVFERGLLFGSALFLIKPGLYTDLLGMSLGLLALVLQILRKREPKGLP